MILIASLTCFDMKKKLFRDCDFSYEMDREAKNFYELCKDGRKNLDVLTDKAVLGNCVAFNTYFNNAKCNPKWTPIKDKVCEKLCSPLGLSMKAIIGFVSTVVILGLIAFIIYCFCC